MKTRFKFNINFILIIFFVCCGFFLAKANIKFAGGLTEPKTNRFHSDEMYFLKTFYKFKKGGNIYQALKSADEARGGKMKQDIFMWRLPAIFYLWVVVARNGVQILYLFWALAVLSWTSAYFILKRYISSFLAFVGAAFVMIYFSDAVFYKTSFLFTEWWGWFFFIFGLVFFTYKKRGLSWPLFLLSISIRELMIIPIAAYFIISLLAKKNRLFFLSLVLLFLVFLFIHQHFIQATLVKPINFQTAASKIHLPNKSQVLSMVSFSMRRFPFLRYYFHLILFLTSFLTVVKTVFCKRLVKQRDELWYVAFAGASLAFFLPFMSNNYSDYWGITFMPSLLMIIPLYFKKVR